MATTLYEYQSPQYKGKNGSTGNYIYNASVVLNSQSIDNNTSNITVKLTLKAESNSGTTLWSASADSNKPRGVLSGDISKTGDLIATYKKSTTPLVLVEWTGNIQHLDDGTKSISIGFNWVAGGLAYYPDTFTIVTASVVLPTIARASSIVAYNSILTSSSGSVVVCQVTSKADFYHILTWSLGSVSNQTLLNKVRINATTNSCSLNRSVLLNAMPNITSGTLTLSLATYSDSACTNKIGDTKVATAIISINSSGICPLVDSGVIGIGSTPLSGYLVGGRSTVAISFKVINSYGATSVNTSIVSTRGVPSADSVSGTGTKSVTVGSLPNEDAYTFNISITPKDSRGVSGQVVTMTSPPVYQYTKPQIVANIYRCKSASDSTRDEAGAYVYVGYSVIYSLTDKGNAKVSEVVKQGDTTISTGIRALGTDSSATFTITATDKVDSSSVSVTIPTAKFALDLVDDGNGNVGGAIGAVAETGIFKVALPAQTQWKSGTNQMVMGSYASTQTTVPNLVNEIRYSNGASGSFNLTTAYTANGVTLPVGWYNYLYSPHRTGGFNGAQSGDNANYGNLLLMGMTANDKVYRITVNSGSISNVVELLSSAYPASPVHPELYEYYGVCSSGASDVAKTVSVDGNFSLVTGVVVKVKFTASNSVANPTLNVNGTGAKGIKRYGTTAVSTSAASSWQANSVISLTYDGTYWMVNYHNTTYSEISATNIQNMTGSGSGLITGRRFKSGFDAVPISSAVTNALTRTAGATITEQKLFTFGKVAYLSLKLTYSTSVASGSNVFEGNLATGYKPAGYATGVGYYSNRIFGAEIDSSGHVVVRNANASATTISSGLEISITYLIGG